MASADLALLDESRLAEWLLERRWFGSKAQDVSHSGVLDVVALTDEGRPQLVLALVEARFPSGAHDIYQLVLGLRPADEGWTEGRVDDLQGATVYDAFADPQACTALGRLLAASAGCSPTRRRSRATRRR